MRYGVKVNPSSTVTVGVDHALGNKLEQKHFHTSCIPLCPSEKILLASTRPEAQEQARSNLVLVQDMALGRSSQDMTTVYKTRHVTMDAFSLRLLSASYRALGSDCLTVACRDLGGARELEKAERR